MKIDLNKFSSTTCQEIYRKQLGDMNTDVWAKRVYIKILFPGPGSSVISLIFINKMLTMILAPVI